MIRSWSRFMASLARMSVSMSRTRHLPAGSSNSTECFTTSSKSPTPATSPRQSNLPRSVFKYRFFSPRAELRRHLQRQICSRKMHWMQIGQRSLDSLQISPGKPAANIHVASGAHDTVRQGGKAADQDKVHLRFNQPPGQFSEILHFVAPLRRAVYRRN